MSTVVRICPLCGQALPQGVDEHKLQARMKQLAAPEVAKEARRLAAKQMDESRKELEADHQELLRQERARHRRENEQLQRKVAELSRKLDNQTSQQLGEQAELDLLAELKAAFPEDHIEAVGHGTKGADIIHDVMDGPKKLGRIVYESKNVLNWQDTFVSTAKRYQTQYSTPYVLIVTRVLPRRKRGLCILKDIPIVEPQMAIALAAILRESIADIGKLRLSNTARDGKAQELFTYVCSDEFATRFRQISDSVQALREQQRKERNWHEKAWQTQSRLHDQMDSSPREVKERIKSITREVRTNGRSRVAVLVKT